ncbi:MAG: EF-hand domain-containing protein [Gemmataceae bacterium]
MTRLPRPAAVGVLLALLAAPGPAQEPPARKDRTAKGEAWEQEQFEEKSIARAAERAAKAADNEATRWHRELAKAYPGKVAAGLTEDDINTWYDLLAGDAKEWRRDAAPTRPLAELFDRAASRLELGPVPSIRRDEFAGLARRLARDVPRAPKDGERPPDADRLFRVLDRDGSGELEPPEWTDRLRADARRADADGNRRVTAEEYREYFDFRVAEVLEGQAKAADAQAKAATTAARKGGLPAWFDQYDKDMDGQVGLYEWRLSGRPLADFRAMDLDGDGLLPPEEYHRYVRLAEAAAKGEPPAAGPPPPERRAGMTPR